MLGLRLSQAVLGSLRSLCESLQIRVFIGAVVPTRGSCAFELQRRLSTGSLVQIGCILTETIRRGER